MNCLDKSNSPYNYYLNVLKASIRSMVGEDEELNKKIFEKLMKDFDAENTNLPSFQTNPNHPRRLSNLICFVSEYVFKDALATSLKDDYGDPVLTPAFGVEYYTYDFEGQFTSNNKPYYQNDIDGYYIESRNKFWGKIQSQYNAQQTLTKPDNFGRYNVINFEEISNRLKRDIRSYYAKNPELKTNVNPDENIKQIFGKVLGEVTASLMRNKNHTNLSTYGI